MCEEFDKMVQKLRDMVDNLAGLANGSVGITKDGIICIELPAPNGDVFAMACRAYPTSYECSFPGGVRNGVEFDIDNPEVFSVYDEVDALVKIPEELSKLFPDLSYEIIEGIKTAIHDNWRKPEWAQDFVRETILQNSEDLPWD